MVDLALIYFLYFSFYFILDLDKEYDMMVIKVTKYNRTMTPIIVTYHTII